MAKDIERVRQMIRGGDLSQETLNKLAEEVPDNAEEISTKVENMLKDAPEEMDTFKEVSDALSTMGGSGGGMEPIALALAARDIINYDQFETMTGKKMQDITINTSAWDGVEDVYYIYGYEGNTNVRTSNIQAIDGVLTMPQFVIKGSDDTVIYRIRNMDAVMLFGYPWSPAPLKTVTKLIIPYGYKRVGPVDGIEGEPIGYGTFETVLPDSVEEIGPGMDLRVRNCCFSDSLKKIYPNANLKPIPTGYSQAKISLPGGISLGECSFDLTDSLDSVQLFFRGAPEALVSAPLGTPGEGVFRTAGSYLTRFEIYVPWLPEPSAVGIQNYYRCPSYFNWDKEIKNHDGDHFPSIYYEYHA